jgi:hypothetical protein
MIDIMQKIREQEAVDKELKERLQLLAEQHME